MDKSAKKKQRLRNLEQQLTKVVFARDEDIIQSISKQAAGGSDDEEYPIPDESKDQAAGDLRSSTYDIKSDFWKKHKKSSDKSDDEGSNESEDELASDQAVVKPVTKATKSNEKSTSVWFDPDDEITDAVALKNAHALPKKVTIDSNFKSYQNDKFTSLHKKPKWADGDGKSKKKAKPNDSDDEDEQDSLSMVAGNLIRKTQSLSKGTLVFNKCTALNADFTRSHGYNSIQFHPKYKIGIVSNRKAIDFFKLEDQGNQSEDRVIKSYDFSSSHIERTRVTPDGRELIVGTAHADRFSYSIDLESGKTQTFSLMRSDERVGLRGMALSPDGCLIACCCENGRILIMDAKVKEFIKCFKMNDDVKCVCFSGDSRRLFSHGAGGQVYIWNIPQERLVNKFYDEGAVTGTAIAASPNGQFLAAGSEAGVVNMYSIQTCEREQVPRPLKSLMNLTTEISSISFNHSSQLFSFSSRVKDNAIRLCHVPSRTVYSNFPHQEEKYGRVAESCFTPSSGFIGMCTNQRSVNLFRVCHFSGY